MSCTHNECADARAVLTILLVVQDLHLILLRALQEVTYLRDGLRVCERPVKKVTQRGPLHDFGTRVASQLTEAIVAEDNRHRLDLGISDDKLPV